jgi:hypothetical protein
MKLQSLLALAFATSGLLASVADAAPTNLALNKPATASSSYAGNGGYAVAYGNDGNAATWWNGGMHAAWWQVDLESVFALDQVKVSSGDTPGLHITFELTASSDGSSWSTIGGNTGSGSDWGFTFDTPGLMARFIRYTTLGDSGSDWATLGELQAIGDVRTPPTIPEPPALLLAAVALAGVGWTMRRRT